jgi:hypothetical protein
VYQIQSLLEVADGRSACAATQYGTVSSFGQSESG